VNLKFSILITNYNQEFLQIPVPTTMVRARQHNAHRDANVGIDEAGGMSPLQIIFVILPNWQQHFNFLTSSKPQALTGRPYCR